MHDAVEKQSGSIRELKAMHLKSHFFVVSSYFSCRQPKSKCGIPVARHDLAPQHMYHNNRPSDTVFLSKWTLCFNRIEAPSCAI